MTHTVGLALNARSLSARLIEQHTHASPAPGMTLLLKSFAPGQLITLILATLVGHNNAERTSRTEREGFPGGS